LFSLPRIELDRMDGRGLLACLPVTWYVALALAVLAPGLLLARAGTGRVAHVLSLVVPILVLYGTTSVIYPVPRFYSSYKHLGVVEYFLSGQPIDRSLDIYQNWPGFFLLAAGLHLVTGLPLLELARWSEPFFAAIAALAVYWAVGGLSPRPRRHPGALPDDQVDAELWRRVRWGAVVLFTVTNWVGQNYFSPQALAFPLSLVVIGQLLRMAPRPLGSGLRRAWPGRPGGRSALGPVDPFWGGWAGALVSAATFAVLVVSHQLSPVIVIAQAVLFVVVFRIRHTWLPLVFCLMEAGWLALAWGYVSRRFHLVQVGGVDNVRPPSSRPVGSLPWAQTLSWGSPVLMALLAVLTLVAAVLLVRRPANAWVLAAVLFGAAPVGVILVQPYGNEGIFRAYLFALPWSAVLIARRFLGAEPDRRRVAPWLRLALPAVLVCLWLPPSYGLELDNYVHPSDVRTAQWAAGQLPPDAAYLLVTGGVPIPMSGDYAGHRQSWELLNQPMTQWPGYAEAAAGGPLALAAYAGQACAWFPAQDVYLFLGPGQREHLRYFGEFGTTTWDQFAAAVARSPTFALVHTDGASQVYRYLGKGWPPGPDGPGRGGGPPGSGGPGGPQAVGEPRR
jgi:hypothetical protein